MESVDWKEYEGVVAELTRALVERASGIEPAVTTGRIAGGSGYEHQIDAAVEVGDRLLLVECKYWKAKVSLSAALVFLARYIDVTNARLDTKVLGAIATTVGYTSNAKQVSEHYGIELYEVKNAREFAMKYDHLLRVGLTDTAVAGDSATVRIIRASGKDEDS